MLNLTKGQIIIALIVSLVIGSILGKILGNYELFTIDTQLNLIDLLSILVTILLAIYIAKVLDKEKQNSQSSKDLVLKKIDQLETDILQFENLLECCQIELLKVTSNCKKMSTQFSRITKMCREFSLTINADSIEELKDAIHKIREILTTTQPGVDSRESRLEVRVENGIVFFGMNIKYNLEIPLEAAKKAICDIQIELNKQ